MIRNLKVLGLLAFAALAMGAMFASSASAEGELGIVTAGHTDEKEDVLTKATIIGEQKEDPADPEDDWNFFGSTPNPASDKKVTCDTAIFRDTIDGSATVLTDVEAEYIHCQAGSQPATVTMNGCNYKFEQPTTIKPFDTGRYTGKAALTCPKDKRIQVHVYLFGNSTNTSHSFNVCTIEVWPNAEAEGEHKTQVLGGHIIYQNIEGFDTETGEIPTDDITAEVTVNEITSFDGCETDEHHDNGEYKQTVTIDAFNDDEPPHDEQLDLWLDHHPEQP